jgi:hypothetical protein
MPGTAKAEYLKEKRNTKTNRDIGFSDFVHRPDFS